MMILILIAPITIANINTAATGVPLIQELQISNTKQCIAPTKEKDLGVNSCSTSQQELQFDNASTVLQA